eukprot:GHVU01095091.1.p1 GENE.GHVU01095091.1~~GHVU01095091.1.p1  ORF type:complete len:108 (+),score=0.87 GHVU01095091.1:958-1281(+)
MRLGIVIFVLYLLSPGRYYIKPLSVFLDINGVFGYIPEASHIWMTMAAAYYTITALNVQGSLELKKLHWLPVEYRIHFKLLLLAYKALNTNKSPISALHYSNMNVIE